MTPDAAQLRRRARELLPSELYEYYARGPGRERTPPANVKAWRRVWLARPGCCVTCRRWPGQLATGQPG